MAIRRVFTKDEPVLRKTCREVEGFNQRLWVLLDDMRETLEKGNGVGIAASQVGILRRIVLVTIFRDAEGNDEDGGTVVELINPTVSDESGEQYGLEGCLSCPDQWGYVKRPKKCTIKAVDRHGEPFEMIVEDMSCRCTLHEIDHIDGILFTSLVDRWATPEEMRDEKKKRSKRRKRRRAAQGK